MKKVFLTFCILLSMIATKAFAYDFAVENVDGVTIYYNYINNKTELEVTSNNSYNVAYRDVVIIPEEVNYNNRVLKVTKIDGWSFRSCTGLTSVTIPKSVTSIGDHAFSGCSGLTSVHISDLAAWCKIVFQNEYSNPLYLAHHLFMNGKEIKDLVIPNTVTSIGGYAFAGCTGLTSIIIPNSVTTIRGYAFRDCSGLTSVHISDLAAWCKIVFQNEYSNPLYLAHHLFMNGKEIKDLVIPNTVTSIGGYAFAGCTGLTSIIIPNSVTSIGEYTFAGCTGLTSIIIPNSVTTIGECAFAGCI